MALQKNRVELFINGEKLSFILSPQEVQLYERAEELINARINQFNNLRESKNATPTQFLKAVMVILAVELLKKEDLRNQSVERIGEINTEIEEINSKIERYLSTKAV